MVQKIIIIMFSFSLLFYILPLNCNAGGKDGTFLQEMSVFYSTENGLPSDQVLTVEIDSEGKVFAGTNKGLAVREGDKWRSIQAAENKPVHFLAISGTTVAVFLAEGSGDVLEGSKIFILNGPEVARVLTLDQPLLVSGSSAGLAFYKEQLLLLSTDGLYTIPYKQNGSKPDLMGLKGSDIRQVATDREKNLAVAANTGLYIYDDPSKDFIAQYHRGGMTCTDLLRPDLLRSAGPAICSGYIRSDSIPFRPSPLRPVRGTSGSVHQKHENKQD